MGRKDGNEKVLLDHLGAQYRLYREEVRGYLGFAAASASLLVVLLVGELTVAKDNPILIALTPLSGLSYGALLGLFYGYAAIAALYSELIELKMNDLLGTPTFIFESRYVGPKPGRSEFLSFAAIWFLIAAMPITMIAYGMWRLIHDHILSRCLAWLLLAAVVLGVATVFWAISKIIRMRKQLNAQLYQEWQKGLSETLHDG